MELIFAIMTGLLASMPLILKGIDGAAYQDLAFHLSRIEGIKEGLLAGKFPVMMESVWLSGKGYPVAVFYGDLLLYFPAFLRVVGVPVVAAYKVFVLAMNLATAVVSYKCFKACFKSKNAALLGTVLYLTAAYRYVDIYVRNATGEYGAFLFFPIVVMAMFKILAEDTGETKSYLRNSLWLALGMTGLIETHLLSTVMTVFLLATVCVLYAKRSFRPRTLCCIGLAVLETLLLNLYFIVPFLDYYMNEPVYGGKGGVQGVAMQIRETGAYLIQLFMFFARPFGINNTDIQYRMQLTVGLPLMIALVVCFVLFVIRFRNYRIFVFGALSVLCLWMSTTLFPWNSLEGYTHLFKLLSKVQFPWRYLAPAALFISLLAADIYARAEEGERLIKPAKACGFVLTVLAVAMTVFFTVQYKQGYSMVNHRDYSEVDSGYIGACEYLKNNTTLAGLEYVPENDVFEKCELVYSKDNTCIFNVKNGSSENNLEVEKLNYKGYVAIADDGSRLKTFDGYNDLVTVIVPAGYEGNIKVTFKQPVYWVIAAIVSLITLLVLLGYSFRSRKARR
ncbi:MAG: hypothetical protein K6A74_09750 [Lachnospiraceae bacterium]|nr:hypothetical protein [Lachnospiraceae bacterium]